MPHLAGPKNRINDGHTAKEARGLPGNTHKLPREMPSLYLWTARGEDVPSAAATILLPSLGAPALQASWVTGRILMPPEALNAYTKAVPVGLASDSVRAV